MAAMDMKEAAGIVVKRVQEAEQAQAAMPRAAALAVAPEALAMNTNDFCSIWVSVKPILLVMVNLAGLIPGLPGTAGAVLRALIEVGDKIHASQC